MTVEEWKRENPPICERPQTNGDRIRAMSDEELAKSICAIQDEYALRRCNFLPPLPKSYWLKWLKEEAE